MRFKKSLAEVAPVSTSRDVEARLSLVLGKNADFSTRARAEYSTDASNYRVVPIGVVTPRKTDDILEIRSICAEFDVPLTVRGGGTSIAGNSIGPGIVMDVSRHMNQLISIDPEESTARVQPGTVLSKIHVYGQIYLSRFSTRK